jgi:hypothetical protein
MKDKKNEQKNTNMIAGALAKVHSVSFMLKS